MNDLTEYTSMEKDDGFRRIKGDIPLNLEEGTNIIIDREKKLQINSLGNPQTAKFIPEICRWFYQKYTDEGEVVLDPFVGSGTSLVEASINNRKGIGIDLNPLSVKISNAKAQPIKGRKLRKAKNKLLDSIPSEYNGAEMPEFQNRDFWFTKESSQAIAEIRKEIGKIDDTKASNFFEVSLSSTIRKVSHVASGQVLPARRPNHSEDKDWSYQGTLEQFEERLESDIRAMEEFEPKAQISGKAVEGDAREIDLDQEIDHIITSPPYINAVHYIWANKLRLMQLGMIDDDERLELRSKEVGTERIPADKYKKLGETGYEEIDEKVASIFYEESYSSTINKEVARSAYKFFTDMEKHFERTYELLDSESKYCLVIGDNTLCGVDIPTADFLVKIAENVGFEVDFSFKLLLKNKSLNLEKNLEYADDIDYDKVIVLER